MDNREEIKSKMKYIKDKEKDAETLGKMINDLKESFSTFHQDSELDNIVKFAYHIGVKTGRYEERYLSE